MMTKRLSLPLMVAIKGKASRLSLEMRDKTVIEIITAVPLNDEGSIVFFHCVFRPMGLSTVASIVAFYSFIDETVGSVVFLNMEATETFVKMFLDAFSTCFKKLTEDYICG